MKSAIRTLLAFVALSGCRADFSTSPSERGAMPLADAGIGTTLRIGSDVSLDGTASLDLDGTITSYHWYLASAPPGSAASLANGNDATATFTPDVVGNYVFRLEVTDNDGNLDDARVAFDVIELPVSVNAGNDINIEWRKTAQLAAMVSVESGETPTLSWSFVSKPTRSSATLQGASTLTPSFVADADGTYVLELTATTSKHSDTDMVTVVAAAQRVPFGGAFIDAVFDGWDSKNRLIAISDSPPRVRFVDPATGSETSIPLPSTPIAIAMDNYGNNAAVATSGKIHIIDIYARTLTSTFNISFTVSKLVFSLPQPGLVHCFTPTTGPIQTLDLSNGTVTASAFSVPAGTVARQHPNSSVMYALEATTPRDLAMYPSSYTPVERFADSPYSGQYQMGSNLWVTYNSIVVSTGNVFTNNPYNASDMTYRGALGTGTVEYALGSIDTLFTIHSLSATDHYVRLYDNTSLSLLDSAPLPDLMVNGSPQPAIGRLIDYSPSYPNKYILVESAGTENAFVVISP